MGSTHNPTESYCTPIVDTATLLEFWKYTNVTYFVKTHSAVIALKYNEKHYGKKMFRLSFGDVLMKSVHKYQNVTKQIFIGYCNTVNVQLNWLQKKLFVGE